MDVTCSVDSETLSRFLDGELNPPDYRALESHVARCASCKLRLGRFRLADGVVSRARLGSGSRPQNERLVASLSVAAALVASLATNALLTPRLRTPRNEGAPPPGLKLSSAPSETLTTF